MDFRTLLGGLIGRRAAAPSRRREPDFDAAGRGRRVRDWMPGNGSATAVALGSLDQLRARSRDLFRKSPWLMAGARTLGHSVAPLSLQYRGPQALREPVERLFKAWAPYSDADGILGFYSQQAQILLSCIQDGECFVRFRGRRPEDGLPVPLQIQVLEADFVPLHMNEQRPDGSSIVAGIELDAIGRRVAYHMHRRHPGDGMWGGHNVETVRVPASEVIHVFEPQRPGQLRGVPWAAPAMVRLYDLLGYEDAELVRKKAAAHHVGFITSPSPDGLMGEDEEDEEADLGEAVAKIEPGSMLKLMPGEDVKFSAPVDVGGSFEAFTRQQLRAVAAALGVTYEALSGDYSQVNYSSARMAHHNFLRRVRAVQELVAHQLCRPLFRRWLEMAALSGAVDASGFADRPGDFLAAEWVGPSLPTIDPNREIAASVAAIRAGLKPRSTAIIEIGGDPETVDRLLAEDKARADGLGLVLDSDPSKVTSQGMFQPAVETPSDDSEQAKDGSRTIPGDDAIRYAHAGGHIERIHGRE